MRRRSFLKHGAVVAGALASSPALLAARRRPVQASVTEVQAMPTDTSRTWLGESFWANRLQDWRLHDGRIECLRHEAEFEVRTVAVLPRELVASNEPGRIRVNLGTLQQGDGFAGLLLGVGGGELDYRAAALAQRAEGVGGGFLAVIDSRGQPSFRDFSNASAPLAYERLVAGKAELPELSRGVVLDCHIDPVADGLFDVRLAVADESGMELGFALRSKVPAAELLGGIMLVSSPGDAGSRWWFSGLATGGGKVGEFPDRTIGPVVGCLHSVDRSRLKMTAQFFPVGEECGGVARLDTRVGGLAEWRQAASAAIGDGYAAIFSLSDWDSGVDHDYRIVLPERAEEVVFSGRIQADPAGKLELKIALYSCIIPTARGLDETDYQPLIPQETVAGRYTPDNIFFPHAQLVNNCDSHQPDLYVFCGDQYYETYPTRHGRHTSDAKLDTLYRWYLWFWTFRESTRNRPAVILADDHDVLQGNLWGQGGRDSGDPSEESGGFKWDKGLVRMVYRIQHGHNPEPHDPTPIEHDIPVTYGSFVYGGVSFALVEDRKFKSPPDYESDPLKTKGELLGERQESFLAHWAKTDSELPKVLITASMWGSPQTGADGKPLLDYDANGYPPDGRTRAVRLARQAKALVLAGDQHLALVARQGVESYEDGPVVFAGPAAAAFWQRWFEGAGKLENQRAGDPNTGNFTDTFGNRMRVLAVANPKISHAEFEKGNTTWGKFLADRQLKSEGYGLIRVDHQGQQFKLECWPWDEAPDQGRQFPGWPFDLDFRDA